MPDRVSNLGPLALKSDTMMVYAKFQYLLKALFCEPSEIYEYKRKLYMYRVPEFRTMLTFTNYGPGLLSSNPTGVGICHTTNGAPVRARRISLSFLIICIFFLTFLEPLIHDSIYGDKR